MARHFKPTDPREKTCLPYPNRLGPDHWSGRQDPLIAQSVKSCCAHAHHSLFRRFLEQRSRGSHNVGLEWMRQPIAAQIPCGEDLLSMILNCRAEPGLVYRRQTPAEVGRPVLLMLAMAFPEPHPGKTKAGDGFRANVISRIDQVTATPGSATVPAERSNSSFAQQNGQRREEAIVLALVPPDKRRVFRSVPSCGLPLHAAQNTAVYRDFTQRSLPPTSAPIRSDCQRSSGSLSLLTTVWLPRRTIEQQFGATRVAQPQLPANARVLFAGNRPRARLSRC